MSLLEVLIIVAALIIIATQWFATLRLKGSINRKSVYSGLSLMGRSWQVVLPFICILVAAAATVVRLTAQTPEGAVTTSILAICLVCLSYLIVPPSIAVLGRSGVDTRRLVRSLALGVFPLRTAHLLSAHPIMCVIRRDPFNSI
jgi:hypothetical protein